MQITDFLTACAETEDIRLTHFLCVSRNELLAQYAEEPYRMDTLRLCFFMTKSFASLAIGIAWGQGLLELDGKVSSILPEYMPNSGNALKIRVRDLLTMSGGAQNNNYSTMVDTKDWVRAYFAQDLPHEPGTFYLYCTHGSHVLSAIVERVSGLSLEDFLNRHLFHPMGIFEAQWEQAPEGRTAGGMGLSLYPTSLAKIAQLLLNHGRYKGQQLIPEKYLKQAGSVQIVKQDHNPEQIYGGSGYGFQFHIGKDGFYRMDGAFGQVCLICPQLDRAFIALSSGSKTESLLKQIYAHFIDRDAESVFTAKRQTEEPEGRETLLTLNGEYTLQQNPMEIRSIRLDESALTLWIRDEERVIRFGFDRDVCGRICFIKDLEEHEQAYVCRAVRKQNGLELTVYYIETPYIAVYTVEPTVCGIRLCFSINVSFTLKSFTAEGQKAD